MLLDRLAKTDETFHFVYEIFRKMKYERQDFEGKKKFEEQLLLRSDRLDELHSKGLISEAEYQRRKKEVGRKITGMHR